MSADFISGTVLTAEALNDTFGHHVDCSGYDQMQGPLWMWDGDAVHPTTGDDYLQGACRGWVTEQIVTYVNNMINTPPGNTYYLPIGGGSLQGDLCVGWTKPDGTMSRIHFAPYSPANGNIGFTGGDGAGLSACGYSFQAFNGIGFPTSCAAQRIPVGLNGVIVSTRVGSVYASGTVRAWSTILNDYHAVGSVRFIRASATDYQMTIPGTQGYPTITDAGGAPATGGTGNNVNDRFYDSLGNTYTATATDGAGAVTALRLDATTVIGAPANPVALTAAPGFKGTGVSVNLTLNQYATLTTLTNATDIVFTTGVTNFVRSTRNHVIGNGTTNNSLTITPGATTAGNVLLATSGLGGINLPGSLVVGNTTSGNYLTFAGGSTASTMATLTASNTLGGLQILNASSHKLGFLGTTPVVKPTVTGAKGSNAALGSLLTALASYGLITDSSTA